MPTGVLRNYSAERGYGFIKPDDGSANIFFHAIHVVGGIQ